MDLCFDAAKTPHSTIFFATVTSPGLNFLTGGRMAGYCNQAMWDCGPSGADAR